MAGGDQYNDICRVHPPRLGQGRLFKKSNNRVIGDVDVGPLQTSQVAIVIENSALHSS